MSAWNTHGRSKFMTMWTARWIKVDKPDVVSSINWQLCTHNNHTTCLSAAIDAAPYHVNDSTTLQMLANYTASLTNDLSNCICSHHNTWECGSSESTLMSQLMVNMTVIGKINMTNTQNHKPGRSLPLHSASPTVTFPATLWTLPNYTAWRQAYVREFIHGTWKPQTYTYII